MRVPQIETQRAFVVQVSFPGYGPPNEEQRAALERWLERGAPHQRLRGELLTAAKITQASSSIPTRSAPIFLSMTPGATDAARAALAGRIARNSFMLLIGAMLVGSYVLIFFGLSLAVVKIAGGLLVTSTACTCSARSRARARRSSARPRRRPIGSRASASIR